MAVNVVSFSFSWCPTGGSGPTLLCDGFPYCILSATSLVPKLHRGSRGPPRPGVAFPTTSISNWLQLNWHRNSTGYIIVRRPLDLWNRMFNRHQAEITFMQFRGHSLPVHHSVVAQSNLHLVPYYQPYPPTRSLSISGHWNVSLPSGASPWNSIFGPGRRSKYYNTRLFDLTSTYRFLMFL